MMTIPFLTNVKVKDHYNTKLTHKKTQSDDFVVGLRLMTCVIVGTESTDENVQ